MYLFKFGQNPSTGSDDNSGNGKRTPTGSASKNNLSPPHPPGWEDIKKMQRCIYLYLYVHIIYYSSIYWSQYIGSSQFVQLLSIILKGKTRGPEGPEALT